KTTVTITETNHKLGNSGAWTVVANRRGRKHKKKVTANEESPTDARDDLAAKSPATLDPSQLRPDNVATSSFEQAPIDDQIIQETAEAADMSLSVDLF
ncbi:hypothetical protein B5P43_36840, partial [Bacillus sp. SRB_336]